MMISSKPRLIDYERALGEDERATLEKTRVSRAILRAAGLDPEDALAVREAYLTELFNAARGG